MATEESMLAQKAVTDSLFWAAQARVTVVVNRFAERGTLPIHPDFVAFQAALRKAVEMDAMLINAACDQAEAAMREATQ